MSPNFQPSIQKVIFSDPFSVGILHWQNGLKQYITQRCLVRPFHAVSHTVSFAALPSIVTPPEASSPHSALWYTMQRNVTNTIK